MEETNAWFYCDLMTDDLVMVLVFYRRPFFLTFDIGLLDVSIYRNGKRSHFGFTAPLKELVFETDPVQVHLARSSLLQDGDNIRVQINEKELTLDLTFQPLVERYQPREMVLFNEADTRFTWKVFLPASRVSGLLRLEGREIPLQGEGYLDFNACNRPFNRFTRYWSWGRFHSPEKTIVVGSVSYRNGQVIAPLLKVTSAGAEMEMVPGEVLFRKNALQIPVNGGARNFPIHERETIDQIRFLISRIPSGWRFPRKLHEFLFYRLDERDWGKKLTRYLANVDYRREKVSIYDHENRIYQGIIEQMRFE